MMESYQFSKRKQVLLTHPACQAPMHFLAPMLLGQPADVEYIPRVFYQGYQEIKSVIQNIDWFGKQKLQLLYGFANTETLQFCFIIKVDRFDEDKAQLMHNLLAHSHYCFHDISGSCVWRNFFSFGIHVSGRAKDVSVFQNQVVLDIAEKTLLIQVSLTGDTQEPS